MKSPPLLPAPNLSAESQEFELLEKEKLILKLQDEKAISKSDISVLEAKTLSLGISLKTEKAKTLSLEKSLLAENAKIISLEKSLLAEKAKFSDSVKTESYNLRRKIHEKGEEISTLKKSLEALKSEVTGHKLVSEIQGSENSKLKFQTKSLQNTIKSLQNTNKKITHKWKEAEDNFSMAESKVLSLKESSNPTRPAIPKISAQQTNLPPKKAQVKVFKKKGNKKKLLPKRKLTMVFFMLWQARNQAPLRTRPRTPVQTTQPLPLPPVSASMAPPPETSPARKPDWKSWKGSLQGKKSLRVPRTLRRPSWRRQLRQKQNVQIGLRHL